MKHIFRLQRFSSFIAAVVNVAMQDLFQMQVKVNANLSVRFFF